MLEVEIDQGADIVVGDVIVALHHPGHQGTAVEIVDRILRGRFGRVAIRADGGDALAFDDDGRVFLRRVNAVDQIRPAKENPSHEMHLRALAPSAGAA